MTPDDPPPEISDVRSRRCSRDSSPCIDFESLQLTAILPAPATKPHAIPAVPSSDEALRIASEILDNGPNRVPDADVLKLAAMVLHLLVDPDAKTNLVVRPVAPAEWDPLDDELGEVVIDDPSGRFYP